MYGALQKVISLVETQAQTIAAMKEETSQLAQQNADLRARVMVLEQPLKP
jgi:cell division protein FtsB